MVGKHLLLSASQTDTRCYKKKTSFCILMKPHVCVYRGGGSHKVYTCRSEAVQTAGGSRTSSRQYKKAPGVERVGCRPRCPRATAKCETSRVTSTRHVFPFLCCCRGEPGRGSWSMWPAEETWRAFPPLTGGHTKHPDDTQQSAL